ncbi:MAG: class I poly(R)-hydroxyalkanoic acid synthase, partial [Ramlibacter sp.]|nr:class I poly(R)-hydroxyalkanoic acid synthase [Ramlibacter sp.]
MHSESDWAKASQQFQQNLGTQWSQAMQTLQGFAPGMAMPGLPAMPAMPQLSFSQEKLQALQQAYIKEAAELWNSGLTASPVGTDKRFASDAWAG